MKKLIVVFGLLLALSIAGCNDADKSLSQPTTDLQISPQAQEMLDQYAIPEEATWPEIGFSPTWHDPPVDIHDRYDVYAVTLLWGPIFSYVANTDAATDWSGTLRVTSCAKMPVRATIDFEPDEDYLIPVEDNAFVQWVSITRGNLDGLAVVIFLDRDCPLDVVPALMFDTKAVQLYWDFRDLDKLDAYYPVDNRNGVAIHSRRLMPPLCPRGIMEGKWIKEESWANEGWFEGFWMDHNSEPTGYVNGRYWVTEDGHRVLEGSVSGLHTDQVIAELKGTWGYDDPRMCPMCGMGHGFFHGKFRMLHDNVGGVFGGEFGNWALPPDDLVMPFKGIWRLNCLRRADNELPSGF